MAQTPRNTDLLPGEALGMVETRGFVGMVEATGAMVKTANAHAPSPIVRISSSRKPV
jgi:hypothetical protein